MRDLGKDNFTVEPNLKKRKQGLERAVRFTEDFLADLEGNETHSSFQNTVENALAHKFTHPDELKNVLDSIYQDRIKSWGIMHKSTDITVQRRAEQLAEELTKMLQINKEFHFIGQSPDVIAKLAIEMNEKMQREKESAKTVPTTKPINIPLGDIDEEGKLSMEYPNLSGEELAIQFIQKTILPDLRANLNAGDQPTAFQQTIEEALTNQHIDTSKLASILNSVYYHKLTTWEAIKDSHHPDVQKRAAELAQELAVMQRINEDFPFFTDFSADLAQFVQEIMRGLFK